MTEGWKCGRGGVAAGCGHVALCCSSLTAKVVDSVKLDPHQEMLLVMPAASHKRVCLCITSGPEGNVRRGNVTKHLYLSTVLKYNFGVICKNAWQ